ncbi:Bifunctional adenosylcobalamin biosynthesis protein CobP [uncultured Thiomicrorhabdus sp.]
MADSETLNVSRHLILGGARSGKSAYAEQLVQTWQKQTDGTGEVYYLATAPRSFSADVNSSENVQDSEDTEMLERIAHHKRRRPEEWQTLEEPLCLAQRLAEIEDKLAQPTQSAVLVDCLTLWMLNIIEADCRKQQVQALLDFLEQTNLKLIMVSNEVGLGVVPMGKLSREFVDELGRLHQDVAKRVEQVTFVTAGLPMRLK